MNRLDNIELNFLKSREIILKTIKMKQLILELKKCHDKKLLDYIDLYIKEIETEETILNKLNTLKSNTLYENDIIDMYNVLFSINIWIENYVIMLTNIYQNKNEELIFIDNNIEELNNKKEELLLKLKIKTSDPKK